MQIIEVLAQRKQIRLYTLAGPSYGSNI